MIDKKDKIKTQTLTLVNQAVKDRAKKMIDSLPFADPPWQVRIKQVVKNRKLAQNALTHVHYADIARQTFETIKEVKARCKLDHAVPILFAEDEEFAEMWDRFTFGRNREECLCLASHIKMSSIMSVKQCAKYITQYMQEHEEAGICLSRPRDKWFEAMEK